jgi:hypothetical protein
MPLQSLFERAFSSASSTKLTGTDSSQAENALKGPTGWLDITFMAGASGKHPFAGGICNKTLNKVS